MNTGELAVERRDYLGVFVVALATLMYEILLTRIFSVTMWYHFAFMAVSIAMFGMTAGALLVHKFPIFFSSDKAKLHLSLSSLLFAITIFVSFLTQLIVPFVEPSANNFSAATLYGVFFIYVVISVPFVFSGICICLALTKFPTKVSKLYAFDLTGAACGCVIFIYALQATDGPTAVIIVAFLAATASVLFAFRDVSRGLRKWGIVTCVVLGVLAASNTLLAWKGSPFLRLMWVKTVLEERPLYEKWNSYSRIAISGSPDVPTPVWGWGLSPACPQDVNIRQASLHIDSTAYTVLTGFDGDVAPLEYSSTT